MKGLIQKHEYKLRLMLNFAILYGILTVIQLFTCDENMIKQKNIEEYLDEIVYILKSAVTQQPMDLI